MDLIADSVPPEEYLLELIRIYNPYLSSQMTEKVIIFTVLDKANIADTIHPPHHKYES